MIYIIFSKTEEEYNKFIHKHNLDSENFISYNKVKNIEDYANCCYITTENFYESENVVGITQQILTYGLHDVTHEFRR